MNLTNLDLSILVLLFKGLLIITPLTAIILMAGHSLSARSLSLSYRALLTSMLALPIFFWLLPSLPLIDLQSSTPTNTTTTNHLAVNPNLPTKSIEPTPTQLPLPQVESSTKPTSWIFLIWISGTLLLTLRLIVGNLKAMSLRKKSTPLNPITSSDEIPPSIEILESTDTEIPLTCGIRRPAIIFPRDASQWDKQTRQAVVTHELTHIRRLDLFFLLISAFAVAIHWPNPIIWLVARKLRIADERTADDSVINKGFSENTYAHLLFDLAKGKSSLGNNLAAQFMAERSTLSSRIKFLLDTQQNRKSPHPIAVAGSSLTILAITLLIGTATVQEIAAEPKEKAKKEEKSNGQKQLKAKLNNIIIPLIKGDKLTLEETIALIQTKSKEADPEKKGVNIILNLNKKEQGALAKEKFTFQLREVPIHVILEFIITRPTELNYQIGESAITIGSAKLNDPALPEKQVIEKYIANKIQKIILPVIDFDEVTLDEALEFFRSQSLKFDNEPDRKKAGILLVNTLDQKQRKKLENKKISLRLNNTPLATALQLTTEEFGIDYEIDHDIIKIVEED